MKMAYNIRIAIEVPIFIMLFALVFADSITTNWMIYRTCYITLKFNESDCSLIGSENSDNHTEEIIEKTQPYVTIVFMTKTLVEAFGSTFICFLIGPWSDKYGRKPVLLLSFAGYVLAYLSLTIESIMSNLSPWFMLIFVVPLCFTGGLMAIISVMLSYITDTTSEQYRSIRMAIFHAVASLGYLLGSLTSSFAYAALGYTKIYIISTCSVLLAWLFILFVLKEPVRNRETESNIRNLFKLSLLTKTAKATFKKRGTYGRSLLLLVIANVVLYLLAKPKDPNIYLYLQQKLHWTLQTFTIYNSANIAIEAVGSIIGSYCLTTLLGVSESIVITLGFFSVFLGALLLGLATVNWVVYAAAVAKCLDGIIRPTSEALVSKIVSSEDTGKVFAFMAMCQNIISPMGSPMYTFIYNSTLSVFPEAFILVTAGLYVIGIILAVIMIALQRKYFDSIWQIHSESPSDDRKEV